MSFIPPVVVPVEPPIIITSINTARDKLLKLGILTVEYPVLVMAETTVKTASIGLILDDVIIINDVKSIMGIATFV
jgi:hypothetical protein